MMTFWNRWFRKEDTKIDEVQSRENDTALIGQSIQNINDSLSGIKEEIQKIPSQTIAAFNASFQDKTDDVLSKLDTLPEKIVKPIGAIIDISKSEILAELMRISSHYGAHDSHDSISAQRHIEKPIQEITKELTGKQKRLLAILLESGFLSYKEIGEKAGIAHESAKNLVNRLLRDADKARLLCKQETDDGMKIGVSNEVQDEVLRGKYRTTANDST
jgi:hypothetical protein